MNTSRVSAGCLAAACAGFLVAGLPGQVEDFSFGMIKPIAMPFTALSIMAVAAVMMVVEKGVVVPIVPLFLARLACVAALTIGAVFSLRFAPFEVVMPVYALVLMFVAGERRWPWLAAGTLVPVIVWVLVDILLRRPLP